MIGGEASKAHIRRVRENFYNRFMQGNGLDVGYKGYEPNVDPIYTSVGVDIGYPGYDGTHLPFLDQSQDYVHSSHCLEHINNYQETIREWFRVLKIGGFLIITVPHQFLYEKKKNLPSNYNGDHRRMYTIASLAREIEESLEPNSYRIRLARDCDEGFDYTILPEKHSCGEYELEMVIERIKKPTWELV